MNHIGTFDIQVFENNICLMNFIFIWEYTLTLSHIHSGYTSSEQPVQAPNSSVCCCLAIPKRPWMQMQNSSFTHMSAIRAYCQLFHCVLEESNGFVSYSIDLFQYKWTVHGARLKWPHYPPLWMISFVKLDRCHIYLRDQF